MHWVRILKYEITREDLEKERKENIRNNRKFIDFYVDYMKTHTNKEWSMQQKKLINSVYSYPKRKRNTREV
jgi:hypothetical protein